MEFQTHCCLIRSQFLTDAPILKYTGGVISERQPITTERNFINTRSGQSIEFDSVAINDAIVAAIPIRKVAYVSSVLKELHLRRIR